MSKTYNCARALAIVIVNQGRGVKITRDYMAGVLVEAAGVPAARSVACADELMQPFPQFAGLMFVSMAAAGMALTVENILPLMPKVDWIDDTEKNLSFKLTEVEKETLEPTGREFSVKTKLD